MKESFWAKVMFREFSSHYIAMSAEERAKDIEDSLVALARLDVSNGSFGAKMVQWANDRMESKAAKASANNGMQGGRPPTKDTPLPRNVDEVYDFARSKGIPSWTVINWWTINMEERNGHFRDGSPITNWKGALTNYWREERKKDESRGTEASDG